MERIEGAVALVTGGAGGIGLALGRELVARGARVVLADLDAGRVEDAVRTSGAALGITLDVTDRAQWAVVRERIEREVGRVDILCNNAGIGPAGRDLVELTGDQWDRMLATNLTSVFNGVATFVAGMCERGRGHVLNTASMAGLVPYPGLGDYSAAKFGVVALSEALRAELAPRGVGVSVLCPGGVRTPLIAGLDDGKPRPALMDPASVARRAVDAIIRDDLYVVTHPGRRAAVAARVERLLAAFDVEPAQPGFVEGHVPGLVE